MWLGKKGRELQFGIKYNHTDNWGGHEHFNGKEDPEKSHAWGLNMRTNRVDTWAKIGKLFTAKPWKSMGLQLAFSNHQQDMQFGRKPFDAKENTYYANYIFQSIIGNTNRVIKLGATLNMIEREETVQSANYKINEMTPGVFTEYAHTFSPQLNAVLGARLDYHNLYGLYVTPRLHVRYAPHEQLAIRASAGKAYRTASIFSENIAYFSTNRALNVVHSQHNGAYGLRNEQAYNMGMNATYKFKIDYRPGTFSVDYYYTHFLNQVLADWESVRSLSFYNSTRPSYAHSMQMQLDYSLKRKMDVRLAYRFHDVQATYNNTLLQRPLNARHRAFINYSYETRSKWSFDYTLQWIGRKRIPSTEANPESLRLNTTSPSFITMNAHVNKALKKGFECYAGVENMLNYMQQNPIVDATNPFGSYFDGSLIWGPVMGRAFYLGVRYKVKRKLE
jgi:outer membrane receptor for ferrienterochelin and colicin